MKIRALKNHPFLLLSVLALLANAVLGSPAHAAGVVTDCSTYGATATPGVFVQGTLGAALVGGGDVTFACSGTIVVPTIHIKANTRMDATGQSVTLSGNHANTVVQVWGGYNLEMTGLTITQGAVYAGVRNLGGTVTLTNCTVSHNSTNGMGAGVINWDYGGYEPTMTLVNTTVSDNSASSAAGIYNSGTMRLERCAVSRNSAKSYGGVYNQSQSQITFVDSTLSDNTATAGVAGGILNNGLATFINSTISGNTVTNSQYRAGGIYNGNTAELVLISSIVTGNSAPSDGGIYAYPGGTATITDSIISNNSASPRFAGGIGNSGVMTISNSTISGNTAGDRAGGIDNFIGSGGGKLTITNSTITGNSAGTQGGGIHNYAPLALTHVTLSGNSASQGGNIYQVGGSTIDDRIYTSLANTIIADSPMGGNCYHTGNLIRDLGYNVADDATCHLTSGTSLPNIDPLLGPLTDNGGRTQTHALLTGSPAIDWIQEGINECGMVITSDQRGIGRPQGAGCDSGAYEVVVVPDVHSPIVSNLEAIPDPTPVNSAVTLTARINDTTTGGSNIAAAEYNIDGGNWASMTAVDGSFNSPTEQATATLTFAQTGARTVCVRGQDVFSNVSAEACIAVMVEDGSTIKVGSLTATISPQAAINAGAQWRLDGGAWRNSGATLSAIPVGSHTVEFLAVTGWTKPANQAVTINDGQTTTTTGTYVQQVGSLTATISPQAAINAGAQWRLDGGAWRNSGATLSAIPVGSHTVEFLAVTGWTKPADQTVTVNDGQTTTTTGTYVQQVGSLTATISPQAAINAGAKWRLDGGAWRNSGATLSDIPVGSHTVEYLGVTGWTKPANQTVTITDGQTTTTTGTYTSELTVDFEASPTSGKAPLKVTFADRSTGTITKWLWEFGDGKTSTNPNPVYTYRKPGSYTVTLTVTGPDGPRTTTKPAYINAYAVPKANFCVAPRRGIAPVEIHFTDKSKGSITGWLWDFGDNQTGTEQNPVHPYTSPGTFSATLTVTGPLGTQLQNAENIGQSTRVNSRVRWVFERPNGVGPLQYMNF